MPVPLLIHIGYHKTATTWLQEHLFRNPTLGFAVRNGGDRIVREFVARGPFGFDAARTQAVLSKHILDLPASVQAPVITQERLSGSPHSGGYDSQLIADRLKAVFPEARILIVIREPEAMILSAYKQYVRSGGRQSLGRYLTPPEKGASHIPAFRFEFFEYHTLISYYQMCFGASRVLVLPYELFVSRPETFVRNILTFCELKFDECAVVDLPFHERLHRSLSCFTTGLKRYLSTIADVPSRYQQRALFVLTAEQRQLLLEFLGRLDQRLPDNFRRPAEEAAKDLIRAEAKDRYSHSNALTAQLIGLPLEQFGYKTQTAHL